MGIFQRNSVNIYAKNKNKGELAQIDTDLSSPGYGAIPTESAPTRYGIDAVIALMRKLPEGDLDTIVTVVKHSLESLDVELTNIIDDADVKVDVINERLAELKAEIKQFQLNIIAREQEIENLENDRDETNKVKQDLLYAEELNGNMPAEPEADDIEELSADAHVEVDANERDELQNLTEGHSIEESLAEEGSVEEQLIDGDAERSTPSESAFFDESPSDSDSPPELSPVEITLEEDGIPVVEAIDLDNNSEESFRDTLRKTKARTHKTAAV